MIPEKNLKKIREVLEKVAFQDEFKKFCKDNEEFREKQKLRNIFHDSTNEISTVQDLFSRRGVELTDEEAERMYELITCFLNKSEHRKKIDENIKKKLLIEQDYKCKLCDKKIGIEAHEYYKIPVSLVGDELENNLHLICAECDELINISVNMNLRKLMNLEEYGL